jgi:hypothetical protein
MKRKNLDVGLGYFFCEIGEIAKANNRVAILIRRHTIDGFNHQGF